MKLVDIKKKIAEKSEPKNHYSVVVEFNFLNENEADLWGEMVQLQDFMLKRTGKKVQLRGLRFYPIKKCNGTDREGKPCKTCKERNPDGRGSDPRDLFSVPDY